MRTDILNSEEGPLPQPAGGYVEARARETYGLEANLRKVTLLTLDGVCQRLAEMPGQHMIAFVGDGFTTLDDGGGADNQELEAAQIKKAGQAERRFGSVRFAK